MSPLSNAAGKYKIPILFVLFLRVFIMPPLNYGQDYFPLQVGNRWVYDLSGWQGYSSWEIIDTTRINNKVFYCFYKHDTYIDWPIFTYYRTDSLNQIWIRGGLNDEHIVYKLNVVVGTSWYKYFDDLTYISTLVDTNAVIYTPAGLFRNCYEYNTTIEEIFTDFKDWLAPNVGLVRRESEGIGYLLRGAWVNGILYGDTTTTCIENFDEKPVIDACQLFQNFPNPFNMSTIISYSIAETKFSHTKLTIYEITGREVKTFLNQIQEAGEYSVIWDGTDNYGKEVGSGIFIYKLTFGYYQLIKKLIFTK
jgi:hypothetical protein